ncbi:MAG TPA: TadE family protein [Bryobacteraceae bacterium]|nr:TadE family protein [Bryobacteraceae bacterium]
MARYSHFSRRGHAQRGQAAMEYVIVSAGVLLPVIMALVFTAQMLWTWHSAVEWTRDGARYAATHCYQNGGANVANWMRSHVPPHLDMQEFASGTAEIQINYYSRNAETGVLEDFACTGGDCSTECVPDAVTIRVNGYQYRTFLNYLGLAPISIPNFMTSMPIESAGCDPEAGVCLP